MAPFHGRWQRRHIRYACATAWLTLMSLMPLSSASAAPKFSSPVTLQIDAGATVAVPRTWRPLQLSAEGPIPFLAATNNSPFGPSRLVFALQTAPPESFALMAVRRSDFYKSAPDYLDTLRPRDLAILLNHLESRVHGDRPAWAARLVRSKAPSQRVLAGRRVIYWEGEWISSSARTIVVRGFVFFGNGAVYLLRIFGTGGRDHPVDFAEEGRFAEALASTFRLK